MKKLLKFLFLPYQEKKLISQSLFLVITIRLSLWIFPFRWLNNWLSKLGSPNIGSQPTDQIVIGNVTRSVRSCSRYVPRASCLTQALATQTILRLKGLDSQLKFGVDKDENEKLVAHAWVESDGKIIIGKSADIHRYSLLSLSKEQIV